MTTQEDIENQLADEAEQRIPICEMCEETGLAPHACPYRSEVNNDPNPNYCTCCATCTLESCKDEIPTTRRIKVSEIKFNEDTICRAKAGASNGLLLGSDTLKDAIEILRVHRLLEAQASEDIETIQSDFLKKVIDNGDICVTDGGRRTYYPDSSYCQIEAHELRELADELDARTKQASEEPEPPPPPEVRIPDCLPDDWWIAVDRDCGWFACKQKPFAYGDCVGYFDDDEHPLPLSVGSCLALPDVPSREACWKISELREMAKTCQEWEAEQEPEISFEIEDGKLTVDEVEVSCQEPQWSEPFKGDGTEADLVNFEYECITDESYPALHSDDWGFDKVLVVGEVFRKRRKPPKGFERFIEEGKEIYEEFKKSYEAERQQDLQMTKDHEAMKHLRSGKVTSVVFRGCMVDGKPKGTWMARSGETTTFTQTSPEEAVIEAAKAGGRE